MRKLGIIHFKEYYDHVFKNICTSNELQHMIDVITTNKTEFFREPKHFDSLVQRILPAILKWPGRPANKCIHVWSAGCATGEEPYTLAMVLKEYARTYTSFNFNIIGTDISHKSLEIAKTGIYGEEKVQTIPPLLKKRYLLKSKDRSKKLVCIRPELRSLVSFGRLNLVTKALSA
jgi:chemotaxis protein methyltransferase CheR